MAGGVGHTGDLTNPRPWRRRCRAGYSSTGGPPLPRKRAPFKKNKESRMERGAVHSLDVTFSKLQLLLFKYTNEL